MFWERRNNTTSKKMGNKGREVKSRDTDNSQTFNNWNQTKSVKTDKYSGRLLKNTKAKNDDSIE